MKWTVCGWSVGWKSRLEQGLLGVKSSIFVGCVAWCRVKLGSPVVPNFPTVVPTFPTVVRCQPAFPTVVSPD